METSVLDFCEEVSGGMQLCFLQIVMSISYLPKSARRMILRLALFEFSVTTRPHIPPVKEGR